MPFVDGSGTLAITVGLQGHGTQEFHPDASLPIILLMSGTIRRSPRVVSAVALSSTRIRVTFDGQMVNNSDLINPSNYFVIVLSAGVTPLITNVSVQPGETFPTWVELDCSEMTQGTSYRVVVNNTLGSPVDRYGFIINAVGNTADYTGVGSAPVVASVAAVGRNRVDVKFSEPMLDDAGDIRNPARYAFDGGLSVLSVLAVVGDTVQLVTSDQVPGQLYTLTIS